MSGKCPILRLRGLPYSSTEKDIASFFEDFELVATHINLRNGKPTGEAYVEFETGEEAARALKERNGCSISTRYIEIFESLEAGLVAKSLTSPSTPPSLKGHVVRLRGLPFASSAQDVLEFFKGVEVVGGEGGIIFTCTPDGRPAGEAYVELASPEAKQAALAKHKEKIGSRYIEIFDSSKGDMYQAVQQHGCFTAVGGKRRHHWPAGGGQHAAQQSGGSQYGDMGPGRGRGQGHGMEDMAAAFAGFGISPHDIQVPGPPPRGTFVPFGAPHLDDRQHGARPGPQGPMQGMPSHWRPPSQPAPGPSHPGGRPSQFSRAPGPPPGKGGNSGGGGNRQQGGGGLFDYSATPPLMMQAPFLLQPPPFMHPQQPGSPWAAAMMASAQQGGGWYGASMPGPGGRGAVPMGMPGPYTTFGPGYYVRSPGMSPHLGPSGGSPLGVQLPAMPAYPRTPPPAAAASGGSSGPPHPPAPQSSSMPPVPTPVPIPPPSQPHQEEIAAPASSGISGRGDSSHSLSGMVVQQQQAAPASASTTPTAAQPDAPAAPLPEPLP